MKRALQDVFIGYVKRLYTAGVLRSSLKGMSAGCLIGSLDRASLTNRSPNKRCNPKYQ